RLLRRGASRSRRLHRLREAWDPRRGRGCFPDWSRISAHPNPSRTTPTLRQDHRASSLLCVLGEALPIDDPADAEADGAPLRRVDHDAGLERFAAAAPVRPNSSHALLANKRPDGAPVEVIDLHRFPTGTPRPGAVPTCPGPHVALVSAALRGAQT